MWDEQPAVPLSVLLLELRRRKQSRALVAAVSFVVIMIGIGSTTTATSIVLPLAFILGGCGLFAYLGKRDNEAIRQLQNEIAIAQAQLPPGIQPSVPDSNMGLWVTFVVGIGGIAATIVAAYIGKN